MVDALRRRIPGRGALLDGPPAAVLDLSAAPIDAFRAAKALDDTRPRSWLTVTRLGGLDAPTADAETALVDGSRAGLAKALGREWTGTDARVLDLPPEQDPEEAAAAILDELDTPRGGLEVFREGRIRRTVDYRSDPIPDVGALPEGAVVLVTGGGRGISARVARELAARSPITLVLVGRGPIAEQPLDLDAEKARIKNALRATGARVTPVEVQRRLRPLEKAEEVRRNVAGMRALGATVDYRRADLADPDAVEALVKDTLAAHGRLDVVIHGAGVEESRLLADKDEAAFHRVYDGKALGGAALARARAAPPRALPS